ncbi:MAG: hypothetical protein CFE28_12795 [Alphaproteobacteria bacterium PA2]|nr:MAG: hypothetical protein CFE28_12795 [Alphaproteobacteria bacterium PA2]
MIDCTTAYGLNFQFPALDATVGRSLRDHGEFARMELDFLVESAVGQGTYIDVGANIGSIALPFARRRPDWQVVAIEAHRGIAGLLNANVLNNRLFNVEVFHAAAGAEPGLVQFPKAPLSQHRNFGQIGINLTEEATEPVMVVRLDDIAPADTRLVKIDVEGYEPEVLKGAKDLIARKSAIWLAEATIQHPEASRQVIATFMDAGYQVFWFFAPFVTYIAEKGIPANSTGGDANIVALPPGVENIWNLTPVTSPAESRPGHSAAYPYMGRYGYSLVGPK